MYVRLLEMPFIPFGALASFTTTCGARRTMACSFCRAYAARACGVLSRPLVLTGLAELREMRLLLRGRGRVSAETLNSRLPHSSSFSSIWLVGGVIEGAIAPRSRVRHLTPSSCGPGSRERVR